MERKSNSPTKKVDRISVSEHSILYGSTGWRKVVGEKYKQSIRENWSRKGVRKSGSRKVRKQTAMPGDRATLNPPARSPPIKSGLRLRTCLCRQALDQELQRFDVHDLLFKLLVWNDGFAFDACFVVVNSVDGIIEDLGDLFSIVNTHADEGEDAKLGI
jgi:hypothetical protein